MSMKQIFRNTLYKGHEITILWRELERIDGWGPRGHRFTASYFVAAQGAEFGKWKHFPQHVFISFNAAVEYALAQAHLAIDASLEQDASVGAARKERSGERYAAGSERRAQVESHDEPKHPP